MEEMILRILEKKCLLWASDGDGDGDGDGETMVLMVAALMTLKSGGKPL